MLASEAIVLRHYVSAKSKIAISLILGSGILNGLAGTLAPDEIWATRVEPLLDRNCVKCHGGVRQKSGLDLRSLEKILEGGERGAAIIPGDPERSHLYQFVLPDADPQMPVDEKKQLSQDELATFKAWISSLPSATRLLGHAADTNSSWVSDYISKFKAARKPAWTPPQNLRGNEVIDHYIALGWRERKVQPSANCDDATFVRRVFLDLAGRIPTPNEAETFVRDRRVDRRVRLVDQLLKSDDYPRHMREVFDVVLMERREETFENQRRDNHWFQFLEDSFRTNRPWNEIVCAIILARPCSDEDKGAVWYLYERKNSHQSMAEAIAPIAFGVQIKCAQCHNDPLAWEVEQRHYWGLVAAFNRSKNVDTAAGAGVAESATGGFINFANLKKESQPALLAMLTGKTIAERRPAESEKEIDAPDLYEVPPPKEKEKPVRPSVPKFSRREALAEALTRDNPMLARAFVNRIWEMLVGRGLVHPVDQMDSRHRPSHPDLLDWLARDFEKHGYDVKRLIRGVVLSRVYQLESRPRGRKTPSPDSFAYGLEKPLSAEQLARSFEIATGNETSGEGKIAGHDESEIRRAFVAQFPDLFATDYNASLQQATFLSNSKILDDLLQKHPGNATEKLLEIDRMEPRVEKAFEWMLGRSPDPTEREQSLKFLAKKTPEAGVKELLWALLTGSEFQVNH